MNVQDSYKDLKVQGTVLKGAFAIWEVKNNLRNLKNNNDISGKELRLQLSNVIKKCTESLSFPWMVNMEGTTLEGNTYLTFYHQSCSLLLTMSLRHQNDRNRHHWDKSKIVADLFQFPLLQKFKKALKDFQKALEIKTRGTRRTAKPEVTTSVKNNDLGINFSMFRTQQKYLDLLDSQST